MRARPTRARARARAVVAGLLLLCSMDAFAADLARDRRIALILGHNQGRRDTLDLRYAEQDASRVAAVLEELGEFSQVRLHKGGTASSTLSILSDLAGEVREYRQRGERVLFMLYYSGHADEAGLQLGRTHLAREALLGALSELGAETTVVVLDACQTAGMNRRKGVTVVAPVRVALLDRLATSGRVIISSSAPGEDAQESERLRGSFFTSHWVAALRGGADANDDGVVELREAYDYAYHRTVGSTVTSLAGIQHPTHSIELSGERDISLTWPGRSSASVRLQARYAGSFVVLSYDAQRVFAEVSLTAGQAVRIGLPPGRYAIRKRTAEGLLKGSISLREGQTLRLDERQLERQPYTLLATKFGRPEGWLTLTGGIASDLVGPSLHPTFDLGYVLDFGPIGFWPALAGAFGRDGGGDLEVETIALEPQLAAVLPLHWDRFVILAGARVSMPMYWQMADELPTRMSVGFGVDGVLAAATWVARYLGLVVRMHLGTRGVNVVSDSEVGAPQSSFGWRFAAGGSLGLRIRL